MLWLLKLQRGSLLCFTPRTLKPEYAPASSDVPTRMLRFRRSASRYLRTERKASLLKEQAVLVRAAHHSNLLELELGRRRIPYVKYGGLRFVEAAHVKDLLAAFRLADNASDSLAWFRLLQLHEGVGPTIARRVLAALGLSDPDADPMNHEQVLDRWPRAAELLPASSRSQAEGLVAALAHRDGDLVAHAERLRVVRRSAD